MSPAGETLRERCRSFPGLVSSTSIDWWFPWPKEALQAVATQFLQKQDIPKACREAIEEQAVRVHLGVTEKYAPAFEMRSRRKVYATPQSYLDFLGTYRMKLSENRKEAERLKLRLEGGLKKLIQAAEAVEIMNKDLATKKVILDENKRKAERLMHNVSDKSAKVTTRQEEAIVAAQQISVDNEIITREKAEADEALSAAIPALEAAARSLENLDKKDITELKAFATPPKPVMLVCLCVAVLKPHGKDVEADGWNGAKTMLTDVNFLRALLDYPKDDITDKQVKKIYEYFKKDPESFQGDAMAKISKAGNGLLTWLKAMVRYHEVAKNVEPKKKLVRELQQKKEMAEKNLSTIQEELLRLNDQIERLRVAEAQQSIKLEQLEEEAALMERCLSAASQLIDGLGSEHLRWTEDLKSLEGRTRNLVGDCFVGAAFLSYAGPFHFDFRHQMMYEDWVLAVRSKQIPLTNPFKLEQLLTSDVEVAAWAAQGLPSDEFSVQNGILTTYASRWPLCIDPQKQAINWIKRREEGVGLTVKTFNDDYVKLLKLAIQYGKPFLFEGVEETLDPMIDPVLTRTTAASAFASNTAARIITLGDNQIVWSDTFVLYMTTNLPNPRYAPEVMGKVMVIDYAVTMKALTDQLLNVVVGSERPDLQRERQELVQRMSEDSQTLKQLEAVLLRELAQSKGSILDNEELIQTLQNAKIKSVEIAKSLEEGQQTAAEIEKMRSVYQKAAKRGSVLYFVMAGLAAISPMYQYSLSAYLGVFRRALREAKADRILDNRLKNVMEKLTQKVYDYVCMGIFEKHKLLLAFQMTLSLMEAEGELHKREVEFLLKGNTSLGAADNRPPDLLWMPESGWKDLQALVKINGSLEGLKDSILNNSKEWNMWYAHEYPEDLPPPSDIAEKLTHFQKLLVIRVFRADRVYSAIKKFIIERLSDYYVQPPSLRFEQIFAQSSEKCPVVFILSPGADPQRDVQKLGEGLGFSGNRFKFLALGQGMGVLAQQHIETGYQRGHWVMLQNCHLLTSWLKGLEKLLDGKHKPHKDFRLWLTTQPTEDFPLGIIQSSLKVVTEPPDGLRLNMRGSYTKLSEEDLSSCIHPAYKSLVYCISFFHAVVQERRKFGKIGWNVLYDFNESDFRMSTKLLSMYLSKSLANGDIIPWSTLRYLIGEAMYGGRVTDDFDRRVIVTYLEEYLGDFLFDENRPFQFSVSGFDYCLPKPGPLASYQNYIKELPLATSPAVFGLHPNAEIGYYTDAANDLWKELILMQRNENSTAAGGNHEFDLQGIISGLQQKLPEKDLYFVPFSSVEGAPPRPSEVVLMQEVARFNILTSRMRRSLSDLCRALMGVIVLSSELEELSSSLHNGFLPENWARLAPATQKPLASWMQHFQRRYQQYKSWAETGEPAVFWLSGFHVPDSLLTALMQTTCRIKGWPLDQSSLLIEVTDRTSASEIHSKLDHGTYIEGLYLEGARWDKQLNRLAHQFPKEGVVQMPLMKVVPIESSNVNLCDSLRTPVYVTQNRRNAMGEGWVFDAYLRSFVHSSWWILQGVALLLNTKD